MVSTFATSIYYLQASDLYIKMTQNPKCQDSSPRYLLTTKRETNDFTVEAPALTLPAIRHLRIPTGKAWARQRDLQTGKG